jgi:hypothetical protein
VGESGDCLIPAGALDIDTRGFWIIPGLIDTHIHLRYGTETHLTEQSQRLRFLLGVTTSRDAWTPGNLEQNLASARYSEDAFLPVPRLFVSARVTPEQASTQAGVDSAVGHLAEMGATAIKIHEVFTAEQLQRVGAAVGTAAQRYGLVLWGHSWADRPVPSPVPAQSLVSESIDAGFHGLAHSLGISAMLATDSILLAPPGERVMDRERRVWRRSLWVEADPDSLIPIARSIAGSGVWIEPLLAVETRWSEEYVFPAGHHRLLELSFVRRWIRAKTLPERTAQDIERLASGHAIMRDFMLEFHREGGVLVTGSDNVLVPGIGIHEEMKALVRAGLAPEAAILSATRDAAKAVGAADSLGTLESGKLADFVVLEGDPLADITNTQRVSRVSKAGVLYDPSSLFDDLASDSATRLILGLAAMLVAGLVIVVVRRLHRIRRTGRVS